MSSKHVLIVLSLILVATSGYYFFTLSEPASTPVTELNTAPALPVQKVQSNETATSDTQVEPENSVESAPLSDSVVPDEMEKVLGAMVKKDRNCTVKIETYTTAKDGTQTPVYNCVPNNPRPRDIYTTYSTKELEVLAYSDARAAYTLAKRINEKDFDKSVDYALRASALSGEGKYIGSMLNMVPGASKSDRQKRLEYFERSYVLSAVADSYDDMPARVHTSWANKAHNYLEDGLDLEALDIRINNMLEKIDSIRREVGIN